MPKCPGQDMRFWSLDDIFDVPCPGCGVAIEFWKDEPALRCRNCNELVANPKIDLGCAKWCKYAKECLGVSSLSSQGTLSERLLAEVKMLCKGEDELIDHAAETLNYAKQIQLVEGADPLVVRAAAALHIFSDPKADEQTASPRRDNLQTVRSVLAKCEVDPKFIEPICRIITGLNDPSHENSKELEIVADACKLASLKLQTDPAAKAEVKKSLDTIFKTPKAREIATAIINN